MDIIKILSSELALPESKVKSTVALIDEGNTIPFISRYRKEVTGSLDDVTLRRLDERLSYLRSLDQKREEVRGHIEEQGKLTPEISSALDSAMTLTEIDDIYRPFRPKRKTRASVARERGLSPLAEALSEQRESYSPSLEELADSLINPEKEINNTADAFSGACDIIAEDISDNPDFRRALRALTFEHARLVAKKIDEDEKYEMYYDFSMPVCDVPPHRVLAIARAEREGILKVSVDISEEIPLNYLFPSVITNLSSPAKKYLSRALVDSYDRLIAPSVEREIRGMIFDTASEGAIKLFSENLKNLLMQSPLKGCTVLGFDPGYRTGCKLAVVDPTGRVLDTAVIYPTKPAERIEEAKKVVKKMIRDHGINIIAIGNGTASGESEMFVSSLISEIPQDVKYAMVSEAGASVYSASELGAEEFPDFDVTERSAVSIARRLQDPLAELVKIDPKAIGVGQYQHDMKPASLDTALSGVVEDCVNSVGVDLNTASYSLLSYIAGINTAAAKNIVKYREEKGSFKKRSEILKVNKIGAKAYEQCAGFLRVRDSGEVLDATGVHPESYDAARELLKMFAYSEKDVRENKISLASKVGQRAAEIAEQLGIGVPTLTDIITELEKPGRDARDSMPMPALREAVLDIDDLEPGMTFTGTVRNVIDFGAFVDIGFHRDGLVHITEISDKFIKHPSDVLSVGDSVNVKVIDVDKKRGRISLSMK